MKTLFKLLLLELAVAAMLGSCTKIEGRRSSSPPVITLEQEEPLFRTKVNEPVTITPIVEHAGEDATYRWTLDGEVVGEELSFTYVGVTAGSAYLVFEVITDHGQAQLEIRIDVAPLKFPTITFVVPPQGFSLLQGEELPLQPAVNNAEGSTFSWQVNGVEVSTDQFYTFVGETVGEYAVTFTATNEDGTDTLSFTVRVCTQEQMAFTWQFEQTTYNVSLGRTVFIRPYAVGNAFDATYTFAVDGQPAEATAVDTRYAGGNPAFVFAYTPSAEGEHTVEVTMTNSYTTRTQTFTVNCCPPEGTYRRGSSGQAGWNRVYAFAAAPGQFVNEHYTALTMDEACAYADSRMAEQAYVSLGGFGGSLVVGFDHSIENDGGYNLRVEGNSFTNSSEPGIVWVMQDENGNGLPDDTWYELKSCERGGAETRCDYAVTYYRPQAPGQPVSWSDNEGNTGQIDYLASFHRQDYYYPAWVEADSYTLVGRKLKPRTEMVSETFWKNQDYEWGYADNFSQTDRLSDDDNHNAGVNANHFKIDNAVTYDGRPANLRYIDFVKVQTGVNAKAGWLGEVSTEVFGIYDYNLLK